MATGLEAKLDNYEIRVVVDHPAVLGATLHNGSTTAMYLTGVRVQLSEGAVGGVYNPALLQEKLRRLEAGQTWGGPLVVIAANHRGPLWVKGAVVVSGGASADVKETLASVPFHLTIDDPKRNTDGSYVRGAAAACDRPPDACCDSSEEYCFHTSSACIYIAEGYDHQQVCVNGQAEKSYEHITDLRVSSDGAHMAYIASSRCSSAGNEEHCMRTIVLDHSVLQESDVPTQLSLSPDGRHYAYAARQDCVLRGGVESCTGRPHFRLDGHPAKALPDWAAPKK